MDSNGDYSSGFTKREYRAPEIILQLEEWDNKIDIWALSCIFLELLTGEPFYKS